MSEYIDMNKPVEIICKTHGSFFMTPADHLGENREKVAYECPKCKDQKKLTQTQESKAIERLLHLVKVDTDE
mgnify:FL=1